MAYSKRYERAFEKLLELEDGFAKLKGDSGGRTMYGIAENFWPHEWRNGPPTRDQARVFYHREFWKPLSCEDLDSERIAFELFEAAVNCGLRNGAEFLQKGANLIAADLLQPLKVDGKIGPITAKTVNLLSKRYENAVYRAQNYYQAQYYVALRKHSFLRGWFGRRLD